MVGILIPLALVVHQQSSGGLSKPLKESSHRRGTYGVDVQNVFVSRDFMFKSDKSLKLE